MRTIIAGSRSITDINEVRIAMTQCGWIPCYTLSGTARGVDRLGEQWSRENNIPFVQFPANLDVEGNAAGHLRNIRMAQQADALVVVWDGISRGTEDMIKIAKGAGLQVFVRKVGVNR